MRIKLDENLPHRLVPLLTELGHDVDTVSDEQLAGQDDDIVWEAAQAHGRFLITQDLDFSDAASTHRARTTACCWSGCRSRAAMLSSLG